MQANLAIASAPPAFGRAQRRSNAQTSSKPISVLNSANEKSGRFGELEVPSVFRTVRAFSTARAAARPVAEG